MFDHLDAGDAAALHDAIHPSTLADRERAAAINGMEL